MTNEAKAVNEAMKLAIENTVLRVRIQELEARIEVPSSIVAQKRIEDLELLLARMTHHPGALEETRPEWEPTVTEIVNRR